MGDPAVTVVPARLGHALRLLHDVRPEVASMAREKRLDLRKALALACRESRRVLAFLVDGKPLAVYGITGSMLSGETTIWVQVSPSIRRHMKAFLKATRPEMNRLRETERRLVAHVDENDKIAIGFAAHHGFRVIDRAPNGLLKMTMEMAR